MLIKGISTSESNGSPHTINEVWCIFRPDIIQDFGKRNEKIHEAV